MSKDATITTQNGGSPAKTSASKPSVSKQAASGPRAPKPKAAKPKSAPTKTGAPAKAAATAPTKAAVKKAAKAVVKVTDKAATKPKAAAKPVSAKSVSAKPIAPAKPVAGKKTVEPAQTVPSLPRTFQAAMPAAFAMNTKLVDIAHTNVSAGLEFARDLAGARTPMDVMRLGVAYWFNHMGAMQAQARDLQSLSASWVKSAGEQMRAR